MRKDHYIVPSFASPGERTDNEGGQYKSEADVFDSQATPRVDSQEEDNNNIPRGENKIFDFQNLKNSLNGSQAYNSKSQNTSQQFQSRLVHSKIQINQGTSVKLGTKRPVQQKTSEKSSHENYSDQYKADKLIDFEKQIYVDQYQADKLIDFQIKSNMDLHQVDNLIDFEKHFDMNSPTSITNPPGDIISVTKSKTIFRSLDLMNNQSVEEIEKNIIYQAYLKKVDKNKTLLVDKLKSHINVAHPRKQIEIELNRQQEGEDIEQVEGLDWESKNVSWSIFDSVGSLSDFVCCIQRRKISKFHQDLGEGPALYLMTLKAYMKLFFLLGLAAIPVCIVLASGGETDDTINDRSWASFLAKTSLGNLGAQTFYTCGSINLSQLETKVSFTCPKGIMKSLVSVGLSTNEQDAGSCAITPSQELTAISLPKGNQTIIHSNEISQNYQAIQNAQIHKNYVKFFPTACNSYFSQTFQKSKALTNFAQSFDENCKDQRYCDLNYDFHDQDGTCNDEVLKRAFASKNDSLYSTFDPSEFILNKFNLDTPYKYDQNVPEPILFFFAQCDNQKIEILGLEITLKNKDKLAEILVASDIVLIAVALMGFAIIQRLQKDFLRVYRQQTLQVSDFTLQLMTPLPKTFFQYKDELNLKKGIFNQMQEFINQEIKSNPAKQNIDKKILSISIIYQDRSINKTWQKINQKINSSLLTKHIDLLKAPQDQPDLSQKIKDQISKKLREIQKLRPIDNSEDLEVENDLLSEHDVQKLKSDSIYFQISSIFITFNSIEAKQICQQAMLLSSNCLASSYSLTSGADLFYFGKLQKSLRFSRCLSLCCRCLKKQRGEILLDQNEVKLEQLKKDIEGIEKQNLYIVQKNKVVHLAKYLEKADDKLQCYPGQVPEPNELNWDAQDNSLPRTICYIFSQIIVIGILIIATWAAIQGILYDYIPNYFLNNGELAYNEIWADKRNYNCSRPYDFQYAYDHQNQDQVITCFCKQQWQELNYSEFMGINFKISPDGKQDNQSQPQYCQIWLKHQLYMVALTYGPVIIVVFFIDIIALPLFLLINYIFPMPVKEQNQTVWQNCNTYANVFVIAFVLVFSSGVNFHTAVEQSMIRLYSFVEPEMGYHRATQNNYGHSQVYDSKWYMNASSQCGLALTLRYANSGFLLILRFLLSQFLKFVDRSFSFSYARDSKIIIKNERLPEAPVEIQEGRNQENKTEEKENIEQEEKEMKTYKKTYEQLAAVYLGPRCDGGFLQAQIISVVSITLLYCGCVPLLFPFCFLFLFVTYWFNKFFLIKFFSKDAQGFTGTLVTNSYKDLRLAALGHFIMTLSFYQKTPTLAQQTGPKENFDTLLQLSQVSSTSEMNGNQIFSENIQQKISQYYMTLKIMPHSLQYFAYFFIAVLIIYGINLLIANPVTIFISNYLRQKITSKQSKRSMEYIISQSNGALSSNNQSFRSGSVRNNQNFEQNIEMSDQLSRISGGHFSTVGNTFAINQERNTWSLIQQISFRAIKVMLKETQKEIEEAYKQMHLYYRISHINQGGRLQKVFYQRYKGVESYYNGLLERRDRIILEVDWYWDYIKQYVDIDFYENAQKLNLQQNILVKQISEKEENEGGDDEQIQEEIVEEKVNFQKEFPIKFKQHSLDIGSSENEEINQLINHLEREHMKEIQEADNLEYKKRYNRTIETYQQLSYLIENFDEEWLCLNFFPKNRRLRCAKSNKLLSGSMANKCELYLPDHQSNRELSILLEIFESNPYLL